MTKQSSVIAKGVDSTNIDIAGQNEPIVIDPTSGIEPQIEVASTLANGEAERAKFMQQEIEVHFHDAPSENDHQFVEVSVNGDYRCIPRGSSGKLRRYHLAVLAQAKTSRVVQKKIVNPDGSMGFKEEQVLALNYPFQVINDPDRRGPAWLKSLIASPV